MNNLRQLGRHDAHTLARYLDWFRIKSPNRFTFKEDPDKWYPALVSFLAFLKNEIEHETAVREWADEKVDSKVAFDKIVDREETIRYLIEEFVATSDAEAYFKSFRDFKNGEWDNTKVSARRHRAERWIARDRHHYAIRLLLLELLRTRNEQQMLRQEILQMKGPGWKSSMTLIRCFPIRNLWRRFKWWLSRSWMETK